MIGLELRLIFPSLQQNVSPFTLLPQYLVVLGKKVDSAEKIKDCSLHMPMHGT